MTSLPDLLLQMIRRRRYWIWLLMLSAVAVVMTRLPLVNVLGFEFAVVTALAAAYATGCHAALSIVDLRRHATGLARLGALLPVLWVVGLANLGFLIPPFLGMSLYSVWTEACNYAEGVVFYLLIPGVTVALSTAVGAMCGWITARPYRACLLFVGYTLITFAGDIFRMLTQPPVFAYNPVIGYFPGPIYDEMVRITPTLIVARGIVLLEAAAIVAGLYVCVDARTWRVDLRRFVQRFRWPEEARFGMARGVCLLVLTALGGAYVYRAPLGIVIDRAYIVQTLGGYKRTPHFDIYYDINAETARRIDLIAMDHEYQYARLTAFLDVDPAPRIRSFIYASPDQKKRLMGARFTSIERPGEDEMHLNDGPFPHPALKHELAHVLSASFGNRLYGGSYKMGFHEGLAVAADWEADRLTPHQWSRAMRELGLAPPLERILGTVGFWTSASSRSYTLCGSFVRFLIERHGIDAFKRAFPDGDVETAYGKPLPALVREWEAFIDGIRLTDAELRIARQRFERPGIFERHCAHEVAALTDRAWSAYQAERYPEARAAFERVRTLEPENPSALRGLMRTAYRMHAFDRADTLVLEILARDDRGVGLAAEAHLVWGDIAWRQGDAGRARAAYRAALALHASDALDREALVKLDALDRPAVRDRVLDYLLAERDRGARTALVRDAAEAAPDYAAGWYLVGRRLFNAEAYAQALPYLERADSLGLPDALLTQENIRLIGLSRFYTGAYDRAVETFECLMDRADAGGLRVWAEDWIARCRWFQAQEYRMGE